jgi:hypothetical protein
VPDTVVELPEEPDLVLLPAPDDVPEPLDVVFDVVDEAVARWTAGVWGWKAKTPAVPAIVAARTMGDRRMGGGSGR